MPLAMEVGLGPSDIVLDGEPSSPKKGHSPTPNFWPMSIVAKWSPILATAEHLLNKERRESHSFLTLTITENPLSVYDHSFLS